MCSKKILGILVGLVFMVSGAFAHEIPKKGSCRVCGMYLSVYYRTRTEALFKNGDHHYYCGVACLLRDINKHGGLSSVKEAWVTDWVRGKALPYQAATYVIGSDLIPDMVPNIIAFADPEEARKFIKEHGGTIRSLPELLHIISPFGMTVPFRIAPAATPPQRVMAVALGAMHVFKNGIWHGTDDPGTQEALKARKMVKVKMKAWMNSLKLVAGLTDDLTFSLKVPRVYKKVIIKNRLGKKITKTSEDLGDLTLALRYRLWRDLYFDRHFGLYFSLTLPTGEYQTKPMISPEAYALAGGLLYSQHLGPVWFHAALIHQYWFENQDDFQKGALTTLGVALHYTHDYDNLLGVELDLQIARRNQLRDEDLEDSGGVSAYLSLVAQRKLARIGGGNFNFRFMIGVPLYQNLYGYQPAEDYHLMGALVWKRRF